MKPVFLNGALSVVIASRAVHARYDVGKRTLRLWCAALLMFGGFTLPALANNLMVEVRIDGLSAANQQGMGVGINEGGWSVQGRQPTVTRRESNMQRLMVMDGGTATLSSVQTQPLRLRQVIVGPYGKIVSEGYVYRSLGGGIRVTPRTSGERVVIEISAEEAKVHPRRNVLTRALGTDSTIEADFRHIEWNAGDILLLCTDGLTNMISEKTILHTLQESTSLDRKADRLIEQALDAGGDDNVTVVLVANHSASVTEEEGYHDRT